MSSDNYPVINFKDYLFPHQFTDAMKVGDIFYYITNLVGTDRYFKFKFIVVEKRHETCNTCPLINYRCDGISCIVQAKSVEEVKLDNINKYETKNNKEITKRSY